MGRMRSLVVAIIACVTLANCVDRPNPNVTLRREGAPPRILVMQPDVELYEVGAGGVQELNAQWTDQGRQYVAAALTERLRDAGFDGLQAPPPPAEGTAGYEKYEQVLKVHAQMAKIIFAHRIGQARLPTMEKDAAWSLGPSVGELANTARADYALLVTLRDGYSTAGRKAMIVAAAMLGVAVPGISQTGLASVIDLRTGEIVWTNQLMRYNVGDLRTPEPAREAVKILLTDMPK